MSFNSRARIAVGLLVLAACGGDAPLPPARGPLAAPEEPSVPPAKLQHARTATPLELMGAPLEVPAGFWFGDSSGHSLRVEAPDRATVVFLSLLEGEDMARAIDTAWAESGLPKPGSNPSELRAPADERWDEIVQLDYPGERSVALANVRRKGNAMFVTLMSGTADSLQAHARTLNLMALEWGPADRHWAVRTPLPWSPALGADLDAFAQQVVRELRVPGLAYAVVDSGKVVHERVLGVKELGKPGKVRRETVFLVGSLSKAMSSLWIASLVDQKKLSWDSKLATLLPAFKLNDAAITERVTLRDAFCACTGLPRRDLPLAFEYGTTSAEQALATLGDLAPTAEFGVTFQYSNQMVGSGGFAAAHAMYPDEPLGSAYEHAMSAQLFGPLGMRRATASFSKGVASDHASPHADRVDPTGEVGVMPMAVERFVVPWAPAGAVWASIADMEAYLLTELADGKAPSGTQVVSAEETRRRRIRGVKAGPRAWYGLGLGVSEHFGLPEIEHSGGTFGMSSQMTFHPDTGRGVVVLSNSGEGSAPALIARRALELGYGDALAQPELARVGKARRASEETTASRWLPAAESMGNALAGTYRNPRLGTLQLTPAKAPAVVWVDAGEWKARARLAKSSSGTDNELVLIDPPLAGLPLALSNGALEVRAGDEHETFTRTR